MVGLGCKCLAQLLGYRLLAISHCTNGPPHLSSPACAASSLQTCIPSRYSSDDIGFPLPQTLDRRQACEMSCPTDSFQQLPWEALSLACAHSPIAQGLVCPAGLGSSPLLPAGS